MVKQKLEASATCKLSCRLFFNYAGWNSDRGYPTFIIRCKCIYQGLMRGRIAYCLFRKNDPYAFPWYSVNYHSCCVTTFRYFCRVSRDSINYSPSRDTARGELYHQFTCLFTGERSETLVCNRSVVEKGQERLPFMEGLQIFLLYSVI